MFNPDSWQSHAEYHTNFNNLKACFPSALRMELWERYPAERRKLLSLNLDPVGEYLARFYPPAGRPAKNQAQILRSLILFALLFNRTDAKLSLTSWVRDVLPHDPVLAALVGSPSPGGLPPLGSYYDFMDRLWGGSRKAYSRSSFLPASKNGKKPKKEIGPDGKLVEPEEDSFHTLDLVNRICSGEPLQDGSQGILQHTFYLAALLPSSSFGLIPRAGLVVSGDGTAVAVHASPFGRPHPSCDRRCSCPFHTSCPRHYSDPDAQWGWDSHEKHWYFGRTLYMLCCYCPDTKTDLPLLFNFTSAKRHDSINFLYAIDALGRHAPGITPGSICLDSAHDNLPTYQLLERWDINALIDINARSSSYSGLPPDISLDKQGHPFCQAGFRMCPWGFDRNKNARKYRCPLKCGKVSGCRCSGKCSKSSYGRTVYLNADADLRFHPRIPRDSGLYRSIYSQRTACERLNNRVLNDYHLLGLKIRGDDHYAFWAMVIGICIHLDAWMKAGKL